MGASLFEVLFYPNLISVLLVWGFARRDFVKIFKMPWRITAVYVLSVTAIVFGQAAPLFLDVPVTLVVLLIYLQPVWTILIVRFGSKGGKMPKAGFGRQYGRRASVADKSVRRSVFFFAGNYAGAACRCRTVGLACRYQILHPAGYLSGWNSVGRISVFPAAGRVLLSCGNVVGNG